MSAASFQLSHPTPETLAVSGALTFATAGDALSAARTELDSHRDVARLEGPPFAAVNADFVIIDRVAEDAGGEDAFGLGEVTGHAHTS